MNPSIFRPIQIVLFSFLALVMLALAVDAWLTVREERQLQELQVQLDHLHEFERVHVQVERRLITITRGSPTEPAEGVQLSQQIDALIDLSSDPETPAKLREFRTLLP